MEILICGAYRKSQRVVIFVSVLCVWVRFILFPAAFLIAVHTIYTLKGVTSRFTCFKSLFISFPISLFFFLPSLSHHLTYPITRTPNPLSPSYSLVHIFSALPWLCSEIVAPSTNLVYGVLRLTPSAVSRHPREPPSFQQWRSSLLLPWVCPLPRMFSYSPMSILNNPRSRCCGLSALHVNHEFFLCNTQNPFRD